MGTKRLEIMNAALDETGNNLVGEGDAGVLEYDKAAAAYDRYLPVLLEAHTWNFATVTDTLDSDPDNPSQRYKYAYSMPTGCLFLKAVYHNKCPIEYEIVGNLICCNFGNDQYAITAEFVAVPPSCAVSNTFFKILQMNVEAACLRGLNEDYGEARARQREADQKLLEEQSRSDRQATPRHEFRSGAIEARRSRRGYGCRYPR